MSNRRRLRRGSRHLSNEGRRPVGAYTAAELHRFLVADGVKLHATQLSWAVAAYTRIGQLDRIGAEAAYLRVESEVRGLTGHGLPLHTGGVPGVPG